MDYEAQASAGLGQSIGQGLDALGQGFVRKRAEARDERRWQASNARAEEQHGWARDAFYAEQEDRKNTAAMTDALLGQAESAAQMLNAGSAMGGYVDPKLPQMLDGIVSAFGGPSGMAQAAALKMQGGGVLPSPDLDADDLDSLMREDATVGAQLGQVKMLMDALSRAPKSGTKGQALTLKALQLQNVYSGLAAKANMTKARLSRAEKAESLRMEVAKQKELAANKGAIEQDALAVEQQERATMIPDMERALRDRGLPEAEIRTRIAAFQGGSGDRHVAAQAALGAGEREARFDAGQAQKDEDQAYRTRKDKEAFAEREAKRAESLRRFEVVQAKRGAGKDGQPKPLDGNAIGEWVDKELSIYKTSPDAVESMLSDEELRAAVTSKRIGPGARSVVEEMAVKRGLPLVDPMGPPEPQGGSLGDDSPAYSVQAPGGGDAATKAQAEFDALPAEQQTPDNARKILAKHGLSR